ncbi:ABC-type transport auxiliary lipoprotein family protein [Sphingomonas sp. R1]|uniref:ABC-type transport auxiliary lipoprotein family protein n=1 Tax=Sphingomonas sp. R1 TaxID=399176 RepID=UPI00222505DC|nr:ABC-type transport auxiliary lipoprotein family protein [Sphingomonas sp. R1]UYY76430.1 ABC-type transport auxiliary lipoprotein family protein [Sphingomonas sp. R1]
MNKSVIAALLAAVPLSGCISFAAKPPASLLTLQPAAVLPAGAVQQSGTVKAVTIGAVNAPQELATTRVPVHSGPGGTTIAYVKDAQWVEGPASLFGRLLADTIAARTGRIVLSRRQSLTAPSASLGGDLRTFGIDAQTNEAVVTFDAALGREGTQTFERRRFEARVPVSAIDTAAIGPALNQAANQVADQVADWVGK